MVARNEYYLEDPFFSVVGGADFDVRFTFDEVRATTLEGKTTTLVRLGRYDLTGWSQFAAEMRSEDGTITKLVSVVQDGPPTDGTLRVRGRGVQSWDFQQAGKRGGRMTIVGRNPGGQRIALSRTVWALEPGSTAPTAPHAPDWTTLR